MSNLFPKNGVYMTRAAYDNVNETDVDPRKDVRRMHDGLSRAELLAECLNGADSDRVQGWHDYVEAIVDTFSPKRTKLTKAQSAEVRSLVEDSGYSRANAIRIVRAGGL